MKNKIKTTMLNNFGYKVLSIFFAIILWIVVMNISDAIITKQIDDIPVEQLNGDVLEELDQIYDVSSGDTIDIIVKGRRSIVSNLSASDFKATADLSTMSITNSVQIYVAPKDSTLTDELTITYLDNTMKLNLEDKVTVQFPVKVKTSGVPHDDYAVGTTTTSPNIITIEGPKSSVDKITEVVATVSVDGAKKSVTATSQIQLYDAYGELITNDRLTISNDVVDAKVDILPVKTVDVIVDVTGEPEAGYGVSQIIYQPQTIKIAGVYTDIQNINTIRVDDIHISGIKEDLQTTIDLNDYLEGNVIIAETDPNVVITVDIEKLEEKTFTPTDKQVTLSNRKNGYSYNVVLSKDFKVVVSGISDAFADFDLSDIELIVDCSDMPIGDNSNVTIDYDEPEGLDYEIEGTITIEVSRD